MHRFEEMKAYVRFSDRDRARLHAFFPLVEPRLREVTDVFYDRVLEFDGAREVFEGPAQVKRLKGTLQSWLSELMQGPWDAAYYARRQRIGHMHVKVGLPHRYMFTAMQVVADHLCAIAHESLAVEEADLLCQSIRRITMLDLAAMTGTFLGAREARRDDDMAELILSHLPSATFLLDGRGGVCHATGSAADLCAGDPTSARLVDTLDAAWQAAVDLDGVVASVRATGQAAEIPRVDITSGPATRSFRVRVTPVSHHVYRTMVVFDEITAAVAMEAERRHQEALIKMGSMSALVAHELRNPLAGISGAIQVISRTLPADDRRREVMTKVRGQIDRLDRMVHDLLAFSKVPEAKVRPVPIRDVVNVVCDIVHAAHPDAPVVCEGSGTALADADLVERIVLNLVQNALAAVSGRPDGAVRIKVSDHAIDVIDNGPGIPEDAKARVFEPFFTTKTTGTGLGLAICANAATAMGATLSLEPHDAGAWFRLAFDVDGLRNGVLGG